jgi:basic membrane protein A
MVILPEHGPSEIQTEVRHSGEREASMDLTRRHVLATLVAGGTLISGGGRLFAANAPLKVAIVLPGSIADGGWSQAGFDAMAKAKAQLGIETAYSEKVHQPEQVEALSDYARRGYTHIIGHGGEFQDAVDRVAARFSDTTFIVTNGLLAGKNVDTADFYFSQPAYL